MKLNKIILTAATLFIGIAGLSACNMSNDKDGVHYYLHVNGVSKDICPNLPKEGWYKKGKKISFKTQIVTDVSFYAFLNNEILDYVRCDDYLGGYYYYEFKMPAQETFLAISSNRFYVDREYSFSEALPYSVNSILYYKNEISEIVIETEDIEEPSTICQRSNDPRDIEYNIGIIENEKLRRVSNEPSLHDFTHTAKITFYVTDGPEITIDFKPYIIYQEFAYSEYFVFANQSCQGFLINYPNSDLT